MAILVLTRPEEASRRFLAAVEAALGRSVRHILSPAIAIESQSHGPFPKGTAGIILTSEQGARRARGAGAPKGLTAFCVGERTAEIAAKEGFQTSSANGDAEALMALILASSPEGLMVHIRGEQTTGDLTGRLREAGVLAEDLVVYRQIELGPVRELEVAAAGAEPMIVPLFSPRSAAAFLRQQSNPAAFQIVAMSDAVAHEARAHGARDIVVSPKPDLESMVLATCRRISEG